MFAPISKFRKIIWSAGLFCAAMTWAEAVNATTGFIYSISDQGFILEYNIAGNNIVQLQQIPGYSNAILSEPNGLAYDAVNNNLIYADQLGQLYSWNSRKTFANLGVNVGVGTPNCAASTANLPCASNATFYKDAYWYVDNQTNRFNRIPLNYDINGNIVSAGTKQSFTIANLTYQSGGSQGAGLRYGDIASRPDGLTFGATNVVNTTLSPAVFYSIDLDDLTNTQASYNATIINPGNINSGEPTSNLQIAFNQNFDTLYGADVNGNWYTVNLANGVATQIPNANFGGTLGARDLGGAASTTAVPAPLPILGGAIALQWSRKIRRRIQMGSQT